MSLSEATAFAESVAGVLDRDRSGRDGLAALLDELGWGALAQDEDLAAFAGLGGVELGRRLAPVRHVDRLLGGAPLAGDLARSLGSERLAVVGLRTVPVLRSEPVSSVEGLEVHRIHETGEPGGEVLPAARAAWMSASVGYLAGVGQGALELTVDYVRQRRAFGRTLAALGPVQQLLADAATAVGGVRLLAAEEPGEEALAYAGHAIAHACASCHQVTGAIGFTLEYPLHRHTQCARAMATWSDALLE